MARKVSPTPKILFVFTAKTLFWRIFEWTSYYAINFELESCTVPSLTLLTILWRSVCPWGLIIPERFAANSIFSMDGSRLSFHNPSLLREVKYLIACAFKCEVIKQGAGNLVCLQSWRVCALWWCNEEPPNLIQYLMNWLLNSLPYSPANYYLLACHLLLGLINVFSIKMGYLLSSSINGVKLSCETELSWGVERGETKNRLKDAKT